MSVPKCPRCDSDKTIKAGESPVKGVFEIFSCNNCNYVWRSTEDLTGISQMVEYWRQTANTDLVKR
jgi:transposase-like protein